MRQLVVGIAGAVETLALFHQLIYGEWEPGGLHGLWLEPRSLKRTASASWSRSPFTEPRVDQPYVLEHAQESYVEHPDVPNFAKSRRAEQGDVDGLLE